MKKYIVCMNIYMAPRTAIISATSKEDARRRALKEMPEKFREIMGYNPEDFGVSVQYVREATPADVERVQKYARLVAVYAGFMDA